MTDAPRAAQWQEVELELRGPAVANPYVEVEAWVDLVHADGEVVSVNTGS